MFLNNPHIFVPEIKGFGKTDDIHSLQGAENEIILIFVCVTFVFSNIPTFKKTKHKFCIQQFGWRREVEANESIFVFRFGKSLSFWNICIF